MVSELTEFTLAEAPNGRYRCIELQVTGSDAIRLKRLGVCEERNLEVVYKGDPMILQVAGAQIGISRRLAELVRVDAEVATDIESSDLVS